MLKKSFLKVPAPAVGACNWCGSSDNNGKELIKKNEI